MHDKCQSSKSSGACKLLKDIVQHRNRPFATNDHMVHGGGQAHYYSRTGTSKQGQVKLHWFRSLCLNVPCDRLLQKAYRLIQNLKFMAAKILLSVTHVINIVFSTFLSNRNTIL